MSAHAFNAPSSAAQWEFCPGSCRMQQQYPESDDSEASREGTAVHWYGALRAASVPVDHIPPEAPNGVVIDVEMRDAGERYAELVIDEADFTEDLRLEQPVNIPRVGLHCWGTPDASRYRPGLLRVYDLKYGHLQVDAYENRQLICYAAGLLDLYGVDGYQEQTTDVEFVIFQPRCYSRRSHIDRWRCRASDLRGLVNKLRAAAEESIKPDAGLRTGPQCDYCSAAHACPALQRDAARSADIAAAAVPFDLNAVGAGHELRMVQRAIRMLKSRERGLEAQVDGHLSRGETVPFYHYDNGRGSYEWNFPAQNVIALGQLFGVDLAKPAQAVTPKQALDMKRFDPAWMKEWATHKPGARKIVPIESIDVKKAFETHN